MQFSKTPDWVRTFLCTRAFHLLHTSRQRLQISAANFPEPRFNPRHLIRLNLGRVSTRQAATICRLLASRLARPFGHTLGPEEKTTAQKQGRYHHRQAAGRGAISHEDDAGDRLNRLGHGRAGPPSCDQTRKSGSEAE